MKYTTISFPGLGLEFNPARMLELGPLKIHFYGVIIAIGLMLAVLTGSLYGLVGRKISQEFTPTERCYVTFALGCVVFTVLALITSLDNPRAEILVPLTTPGFWVSIGFLSVCSSVMAYMLLNYALTYISAGQTSIMANITTVSVRPTAVNSQPARRWVNRQAYSLPIP